MDANGAPIACSPPGPWPLHRIEVPGGVAAHPAAALKVGDFVQVKFDPADPQRVAIDWVRRRLSLDRRRPQTPNSTGAAQ